ncbi:mitochondrial inner membrane protein OXA1L [Elysia marginata]|uniref:Mitochondrial inner membrane protein OXA1L n=1 Tax=Elysia marginata TaxID=1093978 RepID=A0AAV4HCG3_9GAST|nr:mitochondrial inner membrane protein OXA1L [Elysia marginata]
MAAYMGKHNIGSLLQVLALPCRKHAHQLAFSCVKRVRVHNAPVACMHTARCIATKYRVLNSHILRKKVRCQSTPLTAAFLRYKSSTPEGTSNISQDVSKDTNYMDPPADYIPPVPPVPEQSTISGLDGLVENSLNALGEPSLQSLGLASMWPSGLMQQGLEMLHVAGLPWWASIVTGTVIVRLCMFPIVVKAQRMSINMMNHMPTIQKLQLKFTQARQRGNMLEAMRYGGELGEYMKKHNVKPFGQMLMPLCQAPVFVSVFVGLRGMANLPVESMKEGGILFFTDLTITQPFYALPLMTALTFWITIEAGVDGMNAQSQTHMMKWFLRALPFVMWPFISNFPTAMLVYWFSSNTFSLCQVMFLKIPQVRQFFKIPKRIEQPNIQPVKKGFLEGFKESYSNMKASQQVMERQRLDEISYRKAAHGPVVKTYSTNPKLKAKQKPGSPKSKS